MEFLLKQYYKAGGPVIIFKRVHFSGSYKHFSENSFLFPLVFDIGIGLKKSKTNLLKFLF